MGDYTTKNVNGVDVALSPEEIANLESRDVAWHAGSGARETEAVRMLRATAYVAESDPMAIRAQRLEWQNDPEAPAARQAYLDKVVE
ncbi:MAG: hypothetical protein EOP38_27895, partial [Rubrivivax sp.]